VWSISDKEVFDSGKHGIFRGEITNSMFSIDGSTIEAWIDDNHEDELEKPEPELSNYRITWDATEKRYALTNDPTDAGLYFKFGSVIGIFSGDDANQVLPGANGDPYDPSDVAWTPTLALQIKEWRRIPYCKDPVNISAAYHTVAHVKAGRGDPCRLVGLDLEKIKATDANTLTAADIDNGQWRLPTVSGNKMYTGHTSISYNTVHWVSHDGTKTGVYGGAFLGGNMATFLPAAGMRSATGEAMNHNKQGYYRTSRYTQLDNSSVLYFNQSNITPDKDHETDNGLSVRCTRQ
jgi:5-hydroxyisourate hydrolase-like protein (transthyretin family)